MICKESVAELTGILGVLGAYVVVTGIQDILIHESGARSDLSEERDLDRFAVLDLLALLHKDLSSELAAVFAVERGYTVGFGVVTLLERLKSSHEVVTTCHTVCDDSFRDTSSDSTLDDSSDRVHRSDDLGLELRGNMELDLLEQVL